jgi:hypothetical protein
MKNGTAHVIGRASDEVHRCSIFSISWTAIDRVEIELIYLTAQRHVPSVVHESEHQSIQQLFVALVPPCFTGRQVEYSSRLNPR